MNKFRIPLAGILLLLLAPLGMAQAAAPPLPHYWGVAAGLSTGTGLSYRNWPGPLGFQVTASGLYEASLVTGTVGAAGLWRIAEAPWSKFFGYWAGSTVVERDRGWSQDLRAFNRTAVGIGLELIVFDHLAFDVMAGYGLEHSYYSWNRAQNLQTTLTVETALYYRLPQ